MQDPCTSGVQRTSRRARGSVGPENPSASMICLPGAAPGNLSAPPHPSAARSGGPWRPLHTPWRLRNGTGPAVHDQPFGGPDPKTIQIKYLDPPAHARITGGLKLDLAQDRRDHAPCRGCGGPTSNAGTRGVQQDPVRGDRHLNLYGCSANSAIERNRPSTVQPVSRPDASGRLFTAVLRVVA